MVIPLYLVFVVNLLEEGRRRKWMGTQTSTNCQYPVDGGVLNPKEKDNEGLLKKSFSRGGRQETGDRRQPTRGPLPGGEKWE
ncbi:MAG: hypothetical protein F6K01_22130 [Okeania sp. SIO1I7]|nr:hypothetical protein [Okeania sp. SIO1I7]